MITLARESSYFPSTADGQTPPKRENGFGNRLKFGRPPERPKQKTSR